MRNRPVSLLQFLAVLSALSLPLLLGYKLATDLALEQVQRQATQHALEVLHRSEGAADQLYAGIDMLGDSVSYAPCSDDAIMLMRHIALVSSYVQAIGHVSDGRLRCSSWGRHADGFPLGPVGFVTPTGSAVRSGVHFPFAENREFTVVERAGFAAVVHKSHPVDVETHPANVVLATFTPGPNRTRSTRGTVEPRWLEAINGGDAAKFVDATHVVTVLRSQRYQTGVLAAIPLTWLKQEERTYLLRLLPFALATALLLALAVGSIARQRLSWPAMLRRGLRNNEFHMLYQPVVELGSRRIVGAEALIRWKRPNGESIRPDLFIPAAEDAGIVHLVTERVCALISGEARDLLARRENFHLSINLAADDLHRKRTTRLMRDLSESLGGRKGQLVVEATERSFIRPEHAAEVLGALRAEGIPIAIDDFGTGYSGLAYLEGFRFDFLKIDRSFVGTLGTAAPTSQVVYHIIEMAKSMQMAMIAEGVETEEQAELLGALGVEKAQGWLFGKPMPLAELLERVDLQDRRR